MPSYIPSTGTDLCQSIEKNMPFSNIRVAVADSISRIIWMAAPWRWTLGSIDPTISIVNGQQDYTFTKPADFLYLERSYIWDGKKESPLQVESALPTFVGNSGLPSRIAYVNVSGTDTLRISPSPTTTSDTRLLISLYKKTYTPITAGNIGTAGTLVMPDEWAWVFEEGCLWKAMIYAEDRRAGEAVTTGDGKIQYTGQLGVFMAALQEMRAAEKLLLAPNGRGEVMRG